VEEISMEEGTMYGTTTYGVVLPSWAISETARKKFRQDSMGLEMILY
jgi:hypothetical protein